MSTIITTENKSLYFDKDTLNYSNRTKQTRILQMRIVSRRHYTTLCDGKNNFTNSRRGVRVGEKRPHFATIDIKIISHISVVALASGLNHPSNILRSFRQAATAGAAVYLISQLLSSRQSQPLLGDFQMLLPPFYASVLEPDLHLWD